MSLDLPECFTPLLTNSPEYCKEEEALRTGDLFIQVYSQITSGHVTRVFNAIIACDPYLGVSQPIYGVEGDKVCADTALFVPFFPC